MMGRSKNNYLLVSFELPITSVPLSHLSLQGKSFLPLCFKIPILILILGSIIFSVIVS